MKRILLYSPDVAGHPRVYCRVIADSLRAEACEVVVAMGFTDEVGLRESPDIQPLATRANVQLVDTRKFSAGGKPHLRAEELVAMQQQLAVDTTLFIEADKSNAEFERIAAGQAPRLRGRNLGIFANTAEWYPGEDSYSGERRGLLAPTLRTTLGNIKRALFNHRNSAAHFFEKTLIARHVLDEILVKDERLANWRGHPVHWMPEISRPASAPPTAEDAAEYERMRAQLQTFLAANAGREPVLYFGEAADYKGYDLFLDFIAQTPSACAIHAGQSFDAKKFPAPVDSLRLRLLREGRLLETNAYIHTQQLKELFFGAIRLYLTTHRLALSSSTVIQALELGKPVLVPDRGLLGYRVRANNLGQVYRYQDLPDLKRKAMALWQSDLARFAQPASQFWQRFSDARIQAFFVQKLVGS